MMSMPVELMALLAICGLAAIGLVWLLRGDWTSAGGNVDVWCMFEDAVGLFLVLAMLVAAAVQVIARYAFADSITLPWTEEFARLAMVWAAMWGAAAVQRSDDHISMTILFDRFPEPVQRMVRLFGDLITVAVLIPIVWLGWQSARSLDIMSAISLGMPLSVFAYPVPIAGALLIVRTLLLSIRRVRRLPMPEADGVKL